MHYYTYSALIFAEGKVRDGLNAVYKSEKPSTIIEFKKEVAGRYAGPPETYSGIVIPTWQEIDEVEYNRLMAHFNDNRGL
jgi:hypothetical protein